MWSRRRPRVQVVELTPPPDESVRVLGPEEEASRSRHAAFNAATAVARIERFVGAAHPTILQLEDRLAQLETVIHELTETVHARPTHGDLLDVRLHSVRVDTELKRLATELRAEVAEIKERADVAIDVRPSRGATKRSEAS